MTRALAFAVLLLACGGDEPAASPRCAECGMRTDVAPRWVAGLGEQRFDAPKCMFRFARRSGSALESAWVMDYYGGTRRDLAEVTFVRGSDIVSPMGDDLVPLLGPTQVERFIADHGGEPVAPDEVDAAVLEALQ